MKHFCIILSIFLLFGCESSKGNLGDSATIAYYIDGVYSVKNLKDGKILTDEFVEHLRGEVELYNKTKKHNGVLSNGYQQGTLDSEKEDWIDRIKDMKISNDEKIELIDYYEKRVSNIITEK